MWHDAISCLKETCGIGDAEGLASLCHNLNCMVAFDIALLRVAACSTNASTPRCSLLLDHYTRLSKSEDSGTYDQISPFIMTCAIRASAGVRVH